jgi:preprotein translocase subunit YajC
MDPISLFMIAVLGLLIYFMVRNSRKQKRTQEELADKLKPGANVMTSFGLFATVVSIDDDTNVAVLDVGKGVKLSVHRQTLTKIVDDEEPAESSTVKASEPAAEDQSK